MKEFIDDKRKIWWKRIKIFLIVCLASVGVLMIVSVSRNVNHSMKDNQLRTLDTVAGRITENMRSYFYQQWQDLEFIERNMVNRSYETEDDILQFLDFEKGAIGFRNSNNKLLLIDDKGFFYSINKKRIAMWNNGNSIFSSKASDRKMEISINALAEMNNNLKEYLCFCKKLDRPLTANDGSSFTHLILAADKSIFDVDLSLSSFGKITETFVIDSTGKKINAQTLKTDIGKAYNIVKAMERAEFLMGGSYEDTMKALAERKDTSSLLLYKEQEYYVSCKYLGVEDWFSVFLVDENDMVSDVKSLAMDVIWVLTAGFLLILALVTMLLVFNSKELIRTEHEIQRKLSESAKVADSANRAKSEFLSRMSHDIRTPINGIIGMTNIARATIDDKESVENCLKKITSSSEHLSELVNEVLEISRIESGKTELNPGPLNLLTMLEKISDIIESKLMDKSIVYQTDFSGLQRPYIKGDENLLKQILLNLLGNAVKYTPDGGRIKCTVYDCAAARENEAEYHFIVEDTGIGMKKEFMEHIFERFSQESISARTNYEGTGLGMTITKEFVDLMKGEILVESEVGKGSRFEVILKLAFLEDFEEEQKKRTESVKGYRILAAEDNEINRAIVEFILTENGAECVTVGNGKALVEAFALSEPGDFDAILTDIRMPVMDGLEAARAIRRMLRPDAKNIPILAMTANAYKEDRDLSLQAGMNAHLTKPLEAEKIMAALKKYCK